MLLVGVVMERVLVRLFYQRPPEDQILVTFGVGIVLVEAVRAVFGGNSQHVPVPAWGEGVTQLGSPDLPDLPAGAYRHHRADPGAAVAGAVSHLDRACGARGIENAGMVGILGINVRRTFLLVFALGVVTAGASPVCSTRPSSSVIPTWADSFLVESFVVIVIGGLGSFPGAVVGGLIAGEIISMTSAFNSAYSEVMLYAVMALLLVVRPQGLFGTEGRV